MCILYTHTSTCMPRFGSSGFFGPFKCPVPRPTPGLTPSTPCPATWALPKKPLQNSSWRIATKTSSDHTRWCRPYPVCLSFAASHLLSAVAEIIFHKILFPPFLKWISITGSLRGHARVCIMDKLDGACTRCLCNAAAATASWSSMDLDRVLKRTASGDWFRRAGRRMGGKWQSAQCSCKTQDKFALVSWQRRFCTVAYARMYERICIFCGECAFI